MIQNRDIMFSVASFFDTKFKLIIELITENVFMCVLTDLRCAGQPLRFSRVNLCVCVC